jgi:hypothetical protein
MTPPAIRRDIEIPFAHGQSAHCETGVVSNLLRHRGLALSEPMVFGIGAGLVFAYLPFVKLNNLPLISFRTAPGRIFAKAAKRLGLSIRRLRFPDEGSAMAELDRVIESGTPAGLQVGAFHLTYFPRALRFHFNMHNIVVYGRRNGSYLISDPVMPEVTELTADDLARVRFARGPMAPKGCLYHPVDLPSRLDLPGPVTAGIRETCTIMLRAPLPLIGVRGIRFLAGRLERWPERLGEEKALLTLGHFIRMQEEIGTGGAGFRFIYASFLQEAAGLLGNDHLAEISVKMTGVGDLWREFALLGARHCKGRGGHSFADLSELLRACADGEEAVFRELRSAIRQCHG